VFEKIAQDIAQNYYQQHFPNDGQRFVTWYLHNIHGQDVSQTHYCITDGADDKQIDAIVIDDDAQAVYVVQGKFIATQAVDAHRCEKCCHPGYNSRTWPHCKRTLRMVFKTHLRRVKCGRKLLILHGAVVCEQGF